MLDQMNRQANDSGNPIWKDLDQFRQN
jgi:hypothetical protein